jgi:hypothetical protein
MAALRRSERPGLACQVTDSPQPGAFSDYYKEQKMTHRGTRHRKSVQKRCPCGSGKLEKNCHSPAKPPVAPPLADSGRPGPHLRDVTKIPKVSMSPWGVPSEEHKVISAPIMKDGPKDPNKLNLAGGRGRYRVQVLLARPGYPIAREREHKFIDGVVGSSHIKLMKPEAERGENDADRIVLQLLGKNYQIIGSADKEGCLGKLVAELDADNVQAAEHEVYGAIAPFLSAWAMNADVPLHVETIQVTDLTTHASSLRVTTPHFEMNFPGAGTPPFFQDEFCQYASIYREGLNTNSAFYRFLCFYKIIESLITRRSRMAGARRAAGQDPRCAYETIPQEHEGILALLNRLYPWRQTWDKMAIGQYFPNEVLGQRVTAIRDRHLRPLRLGIAHALLDQGEITVILDKMEYIQTVNKWLPLSRLCARWMLLTDFPHECSMAMK